MEVIRTSGLCKKYGTKNAVENLDMIVPQGAIYGFIGQNGAGKSTTQKMVCGLANPTSGSIQLFGKPVDNEATRRKVGMLIERAGIYPDISAHENLMLYGLCIGITDIEKRVAESLEVVGLSDAGKKKTRHFSTGMKQRLGIAMALLGKPELLVLDEPINGLDPEGIREFRQIILRLNGELGMTILISSHMLDELSKVATHYGIIKNGRMMQQISANELSNNCQEYLCVRVNDSEKAANLLNKQLQMVKCEVYSADELRVHGVTDSGAVTQLLAVNGFTIREIFQYKQDLESYFLDYMGGADNA